MMATRAEIVLRRPNDARSIGRTPRLLPPPSRGQARCAPYNDRNGPVPTDGPDRVFLRPTASSLRPGKRQTKPIGPAVGGRETGNPKLEILFEYKEMVGTADPTAWCSTGGVKQTQFPRFWLEKAERTGKQSQSWPGRPWH